MPLVILVAGNTIPEVAARRGDFPRWVLDAVGDAWAGPWAEHDVRTEAAPPPFDAVDGLIVTGSGSSVTERAPWMRRTEDYLRSAASAGVPVFGICFGHQMLAQALGGEVAKSPRGREIGTVRVERLAEDPIFQGVPAAFDASATHLDTVTRLPEGARVLAKTALEPTAAFAWGERARAVQFHPEIDADVMHGYISARAGIMRSEGLDPDAAKQAVREAPHAREVLRNFVLELVRNTYGDRR